MCRAGIAEPLTGGLNLERQQLVWVEPRRHREQVLQAPKQKSSGDE
jgi:hypothetical protein